MKCLLGAVLLFFSSQSVFAQLEIKKHSRGNPNTESRVERDLDLESFDELFYTAEQFMRLEPRLQREYLGALRGFMGEVQYPETSFAQVVWDTLIGFASASGITCPTDWSKRSGRVPPECDKSFAEFFRTSGAAVFDQCLPGFGGMYTCFRKDGKSMVYNLEHVNNIKAGATPEMRAARADAVTALKEKGKWGSSPPKAADSSTPASAAPVSAVKKASDDKGGVTAKADDHVRCIYGGFFITSESELKDKKAAKGVKCAPKSTLDAVIKIDGIDPKNAKCPKLSKKLDAKSEGGIRVVARAAPGEALEPVVHGDASTSNGPVLCNPLLYCLNFDNSAGDAAGKTGVLCVKRSKDASAECEKEAKAVEEKMKPPGYTKACKNFIGANKGEFNKLVANVQKHCAGGLASGVDNKPIEAAKRNRAWETYSGNFSQSCESLVTRLKALKESKVIGGEGKGSFSVQ